MDSIVIDRPSKLGAQDRVTAYCGDWRCPRHSGGVEIDVPAMMALHGDLEIAGLPGRLRCSVCGHRPGAIRLGWTLASRERSEERRVGNECVSTFRSRWSPYHYKKKNSPLTQHSK